jgi:hypothetical protein
MRAEVATLVGILIGATLACGEKRREHAVIKTASIDVLEGADRLLPVDGGIAAEWAAFDAPEPAPRRLAIVDPRTKKIIAEDHGWFVRASARPDAAIVVDEGDHELEYRVRRFGGADAVQLPARDGSWVLRAATCGERAELCALVRWSTPTPGQLEHVVVTAIERRPLRVRAEWELDHPGVLAGTTAIGGVASHPVDSVIYVLERGAAGDAVAVRALDLSNGATIWRADVPATDENLSARTAQLLVSSDGKRVLVVQGGERRGYQRIERLSVIDSATGVLARTVDANDLPDFLSAVGVLAAPRRGTSEFVFARIASTKGIAGESYTDELQRLVTFDPDTGAFRTVYRGSGTEFGAWVIATTDEKTVIVVGSYQEGSVADVTAPAQQQRRRERVAAMLASQ